jgi:hypothetical protein
MMVVELMAAFWLFAGAQTVPPSAQETAAQEQSVPPSDEGTDEEDDTPESGTAQGVTSPLSPLILPPLPALNLPDNPSLVGQYSRDYEGPLSDAELRYQASISSGVARSIPRNSIEGAWELSLSGSSPFVMFEFRQVDKVRARIDGAWRGLGQAPLHYGFLSDVTRFGNELEINFVKFNEPAPHVLFLTRLSDALWRGTMLAPDGTKQDVTLKRQGIIN